MEDAQKLFAVKITAWAKDEEYLRFEKHTFGLGANTRQVMFGMDDIKEGETIKKSYEEDRKVASGNFVENPTTRSKEAWEATEKTQGFYPSANGALMNSSFVVQFFSGDLKKAQFAAEELAKVTHYDPAVSAHCVAYVTMLWLLADRK